MLLPHSKSDGFMSAKAAKQNRKYCECNFAKASIGGRQINARTSS